MTKTTKKQKMGGKNRKNVIPGFQKDGQREESHTQDLKADKVKSTREPCHALPAPNDAWLGRLDCRYIYAHRGPMPNKGGNSRFAGGAAIYSPPV